MGEATKRRLGWMDALRGMSIFLVVFSHAVGRSADDVGRHEALSLVDQMMGPFRMPTMVFLSGLLLQTSLAKGTRRYVEGKLRNVLHPYVVWSVIYISVHIASTRITGLSFTLADIPRLVFDPPFHLWFLHYLFLFYMAMLAFRRVPRPVLIGAGLLLAAVSSGPYLPRFWFLFTFFVLGEWAIQHRARWERLVRNPVIVVASTIAVASVVLIVPSLGDVRYQVASWPLSLAGVVVLTRLALAIGDTSAAATVRYVGRNSLTVYIVHPLVLSVTTQVLTFAVPGLGGWSFITLALVAGLGASLVVVWLTGVLPPVRALFSFPTRSAAPVPAGARAMAVPQAVPRDAA